MIFSDVRFFVSYYAVQAVHSRLKVVSTYIIHREVPEISYCPKPGQFPGNRISSAF
jgi:hypothetical protein